MDKKRELTTNIIVFILIEITQNQGAAVAQSMLLS